MTLKRNITITVRLTEKELSALNTDVQRTGLSREAYVRSLINGFVPATRPSADYQKLLQYLRITCNNLNQIAMIANKDGNINAENYGNEVRNLKKIILEIKQEQSKEIDIYGCDKNMGY